MAKSKFKKRKDQRRSIRGEMTKLGIVGKLVAKDLGINPSSVSKYCATSPRIVAALIKRGVPARLFGEKVLHALAAESRGAEGERACAG